jgi:hypothetical protein
VSHDVLRILTGKKKRGLSDAVRFSEEAQRYRFDKVIDVFAGVLSPAAHHQGVVNARRNGVGTNAIFSILAR